MDAIVSAAPAEPLFRMVSVDLIDEPPSDMRRVPRSARAQLALTASIRRRGIEQPIAVRPKNNRFELVFGRGRLTAARTLEMPRVPAVIRAWSDDEVLGAQAAENLVREAPHPIDIWCTVAELVAGGYTVAEAAEECGLDDATTRRMERLGRLHPDVLKLVEIEMPSDRHLRVIAMAPRRAQAASVKGRVKRTLAGGREDVLWHEIAGRCAVERITRDTAIFDADAHPELWEEDIFAQPDDADRFTTSNLARFRELQQAALEAQVVERRGRKERVQLVQIARDGLPELPKGYALVSGGLANRKPGRTECIFVAMHPDGRIGQVLAVDKGAAKAAEKQRQQRQKAKTADAGAGDDEPEAEAPLPAPRVSKAAQDFVAAAKTQALHAALAKVSPETMLRLLLMMLAADNVTIHATVPDDVWSFHEFIGRRMVAPGGQPIALSQADLALLAADVLTAVLRISGPNGNRFNSSGSAAEWIGATIDAAAELPRFDVAEYLAHLPPPQLKNLALRAGLRATGTTAQLREALAGRLPDWRPDDAAFGAAAPRER